MVEVSSLSVVVGYDDSAVTSGVAKTSQAVSGLSATMGSIFSGIGLAAGERIFDTITSGFKAGADAAIGFNSNLEQSTIAFTSMLGSAEKAQAFLADMKQFAATTPFEFPDLLQASKQMMAFGFAAKDVRPLLTAVGSAAAAMGTGRGGVDSITKALGQMRAATVVQAGELNQLTEQGVPAFQILADAMGISTGEVKKLASEGKIASDVFIDAFQVWAKSNYGDMMAKQALTFEGAMSNIKDSLTFAVADAFRPFFEVISAGAVQLGEFVQSETFTAWAKTVADTTRDAFRQIGDAVRTVQQVLAGDWAPSDSIEPFALAVGNAAVMLRDTFGPAISAVSSFVTGTLMPAIQQLAAPLAAFSAGFLATVAASGLVTAAIAGVTAVLGLLLTPLGAVAVAVGLLAAAWTTNFGGIQQITQQFVAIVQQALSGDVAGAFTAFIALVVTVGQQIVAQLLVWGQAFVDWIAPMIPPMLAAAAALAAQLLGWIVAQVPVWTTAFLAWATEWVQWLTVATPLLLAAAAAFIAPLLAWVQAQVPIWTAQLLLWGQEFVAWIAPQIQPLLAALATLGAALLAWIVAQVPPLIAQLLTWGAEFVAWIAPQIDPMVRSLGTLALAMIDWIIAQVPTIVENLVKWGLLFGAWVVGSAIPELVRALPGILTTINAWIVDAQAALGERLIAFGKAWVDGIFKGFTDAWAIIGPKITETIKSVFVMPSFGGGGVPGATQMSFNGAQGSSAQRAVQYARQAGLPDPELFAAQIYQESGFNTNAVSSAGARGIGQFMPGTGASVARQLGVSEAEFWANPDLQLQGAALHMADLTRQFGSQQRALSAYYSGPGGGVHPEYVNAVEAQRGNVRPMLGGAGTSPMDMQKIPLGGGDMGDPGHWPVLMDDVHNDLLPQWLQDMAAMTQAGQQAFTTVAQSGQTEGTALVSASTDSLGNVTRIYTENGVAIGATITDAAGVVVNSFGSMGTGAVAAAGAMATGVTGQAAVMATGVTEQANLMTSGALTSVTSLGTGILTTVQATSGTTIATVTDMQGQVTSQYATLANGAQLSMDGLSAGVMTSTTDLGTGVLTIVQDTSGNYIATVTDMAGNVVGQYTQLGADTVQAATDMATGTAEQATTMQTDVTEQAQTMADTVLTSVTDLGDGVLTITRDASGQMVATITDMSGQVVETYSSMGSDVQGTMEEFASTTAEQFHSVEGPAQDAAEAMQAVGDVQIDAPDVSDVIDAMKDIQKAADRARSAVDTVDGKGGKKGGSGKKDPDFGKAVGGPVNMGQTYLVGEEGPELFTPGSSGAIIPNDRLAFGGGGGTVVVNVHVNGSLLASRRDIEEAVVVGLESARKRGRV